MRKRTEVKILLDICTQVTTLGKGVTNYLIHLIPCGVEIFINDFAGKDLGTYSCNSIWIWLALNHPFDVFILRLQVFGLYQMHTDNTLDRKKWISYRVFWKKHKAQKPLYTHHTRVCLTLGTGERSSAASCRSGTNGMSKRLGRTKKEAMESMIIVSETELQKKAFYFNIAPPHLPHGPLWFPSVPFALLIASTTHSFITSSSIFIYAPLLSPAKEKQLTASLSLLPF